MVMNNGRGIPIVRHKEHGCYVATLIFGQLLTVSSRVGLLLRCSSQVSPVANPTFDSQTKENLTTKPENLAPTAKT